MALVVTTVFQGVDTFIADCAWLDSDSAGGVPHGLGVIPQEVYYTYLASGSAGMQQRPNISASTINSIEIILFKGASGLGSGAAANGRLIVKRPHSLGR